MPTIHCVLRPLEAPPVQLKEVCCIPGADYSVMYRSGFGCPEAVVQFREWTQLQYLLDFCPTFSLDRAGRGVVSIF